MNTEVLQGKPAAYGKPFLEGIQLDEEAPINHKRSQDTRI